MMLPTLSPSELALIVASKKMTRANVCGGSMVAVGDHGKVLFATGGPDSFAALWAQAERARAAGAITVSGKIGPVTLDSCRFGADGGPANA